MRLIFASVRLFPYFAFPIAIILAEVGRHYRRKHSPKQWTCWGVAFGLMLLTVLWVVFRGDVNSDHWVKAVIGGG